MKTYPRYKDSGIPWIGRIPEHWEVKQIRQCFQARSEKVSDTDFQPLSVSKQGIVPQLETACKTNNGENRKLVRKGDFVVNSRSDRKGSCGISAYDGSVTLISTVLTPRLIEGTFCHYLLRSNNYVEEFYKNGRGIVADLWTTRLQEMRGIYLPIPPISEQRAIASYLKVKTLKIEQYVAEREREREQLESLRQTEIAHVVTRGLNPDAPLKDSGVPWIGDIPAHWEMRRIKNIFFEKKDKSETGTELSLSLSRDKGIVPFSEKKNKTLESASLIGSKKVSIGNVVFNRFKARLFAVSNYDGVVSSDYAVYECRKDADANFMTFLFNTQTYREAFNRKASGVGDGFSRLYTDDLFAFYAVFPPLPEQLAIVSYIEAKLGKIDAHIAALEREIALLREYKQRLVSDAVTGRICVTE